MQLTAANRSASQAELAHALQIDKATLVALIDKAESAGWLSRRRAQEDRRRHELVLTPKGREKVRKLARQTNQFEERFRARFTYARATSPSCSTISCSCGRGAVEA